MTTEYSEIRCRVCGHTKEWHSENAPVHVFSADSAKPTLPPPQQSRTQTQGDPVLRLTLLKKGIITEKDLDETQTLVMKATEMGMVIVVNTDSQGEIFLGLVDKDQFVREMMQNASS